MVKIAHGLSVLPSELIDGLLRSTQVRGKVFGKLEECDDEVREHVECRVVQSEAQIACRLPQG